MLTFWKGCSVIKGGTQGNAGAINDYLTFLSEIHGDPAADIALDLSCSPFGVVRVSYQHSGGIYRVQVFQCVPFKPEA